MTQFKLPNREYTEDVTRYELEWNRIIFPVEELLDVKVIGFDPGLLVRDRESDATVNIPLWLVERILDI